jgi:hypothetical protein
MPPFINYLQRQTAGLTGNINHVTYIPISVTHNLSQWNSQAEQTV